MINFCPECGIRLEREYKFCPNCGTQLKIEEDTSKYSSFERNEIKSAKIYCKNCGEENDIDNIVCSSCGIKLQNSIGKSKTQKKPGNKGSRIIKNPAKNQNEKELRRTGTKTLNKQSFLIILGVLLVIAIIVILSSDIIDKPAVQEVSTQSPPVQSGVDLNSINRINELEAQLKNSPDNNEVRLQLAHLQNDAGFYDKAISNYKKYLEVNPKDTDARIDMGVCYYNLGNYPTAIDEMQKAIKNQPNHQIGNLNLGIVNLAAGNLDKSKEWLEKAVAINPGSDAGKRAEELLKSHEK